jgi:polysaccharide biosynthesis transport protein
MPSEQSTQAISKMQSRPLIQLFQSSEQEDMEQNRGLNFKSLGRTLRRNALLITGVTTAISALTWFLALSTPAAFKGNFRLLVEPVSNEERSVEPSAVTRADGTVPGRDAFGLDYQTQLQILKSEEMLESIMQDVRSQYPDFSAAELSKGLKVLRLAENNDPNNATKIIEVTFEGKDPGLVQKVLQTTADRFLRYSLEDRKTSYGQGLKFIEDQLPELQQRVDRIQNELQNLQQQYDLVDPTAQGGQLSDRINDILTLQLDTQRELQEQQTLRDGLRRQLQLTPQEAIAASSLSEDATYRAHLGSLAEIDAQLAVERARFEDASPVVMSLQRRRDNINSLIKQRSGEVLGGNSGGPASNTQVLAYPNAVRLGLIDQLMTAENQINMLQIRGQQIAQSRGVFENRLKQFPAVSRRYADLTRNLELATETLNRLLTQRETLRIESAQTEVPWEIVSKPLIPRDSEGNPVEAPSRKNQLIFAGILGGLLAGTLLALLLERYRNVFCTVDDLQEGLQLPLSGIIPFSRGARQSMDFPSSFAVEDIEDSRSGAASFREAFSDLYANIRLAEPAIRSVMICSAEAGDGKTTNAVYLAQTAAGAGQRVLLVDTNLRLPQVHVRMDLPNSRGLSNALTSNQPLKDFIQQSPLADNLFIMTAGTQMPGSSRLLASDQMKELMEQVQSDFDLVIYDTPHLYGLTDANFLSTQVDEVLLVTAVNKTSRTALEQVLAKLKTLPLRGVSLVANYLKESNSQAGLRATSAMAAGQRGDR